MREVYQSEDSRRWRRRGRKTRWITPLSDSKCSQVTMNVGRYKQGILHWVVSNSLSDDGGDGGSGYLSHLAPNTGLDLALKAALQYPVILSLVFLFPTPAVPSSKDLIFMTLPSSYADWNMISRMLSRLEAYRIFFIIWSTALLAVLIWCVQQLYWPSQLSLSWRFITVIIMIQQKR
jgi:hypothetical protein